MKLQGVHASNVKSYWLERVTLAQKVLHGVVRTKCLLIPLPPMSQGRAFQQRMPFV